MRQTRLVSPSRYFRRRWDESRGDQFDHWGPADYLFETDDSMWAIRQVEIYDGGQRRRYGPGHLEDEFGGLAQTPVFASRDEPAEFEITRADFEYEWDRIETIGSEA